MKITKQAFIGILSLILILGIAIGFIGKSNSSTLSKPPNPTLTQTPTAQPTPIIETIQPISTSAPINTVKPALQDTNDWNTVTLKSIRLKVPPGTLYQEEDSLIVTIPPSVVPSIRVSVAEYDGGSRRAWWITQLHATTEEVQKYLRFQEVTLGAVQALDVFADGGWWQGGGASPILIAKGKTIVIVDGGRNFNYETGKTTRWIISDTVSSTVEFL